MSGRHLARALTLSLAGVLSVHRSAAAQIRGAATFRERTALPAGAVFEAFLEDVSRAGARPVVLGTTRIERPRNPPIRFEIPFNASRIEPGHRYEVRARILVGARPIFVTDQRYPVLTAGRGRQVSLLLHRPSSEEPVARAPATRDSAAGELAAPDAAPSGGGSRGSGSAIFTGDLPCADCTAVREQLELFPDQSFFLRRTYVGKPRGTTSDDIGRWTLSNDGRTLTLLGGGDAPTRLAIGKPNTLRMLSAAGAPIASPRPSELTLTTRAAPLEPRLRMRGMYRYMGDAGRFTECLTRQSWPVAQERDNAALQSAYSGERSAPGEEVLVDVVGRVAMRPTAEGNGRERTLVVDKFVGVWPGESCGSRTPTEPLENTSWKLTRVGDMPVSVSAGQREPFFILHPGTGRVSGTSTCNRLLGRYEANGTQLTFSEVAASKMACPAGMEVEKRFLAALRAASTAKITRQHLELFDAHGKFLAGFDAGRTN